MNFPAFCIHEPGTLFKIHFLGFVTDAVINLICLVCMELAAGEYLHQQDMVRIAGFIQAAQDFCFCINRRDTVVKWGTEQLIDVLFVPIDPRDIAIVFNTYANCPTVCIGKSDDCYSKCFCFKWNTVVIDCRTQEQGDC